MINHSKKISEKLRKEKEDTHKFIQSLGEVELKPYKPARISRTPVNEGGSRIDAELENYYHPTSLRFRY